MGFFSWKTQDTDKSIPSAYNNIKPTIKVYMWDNKGNVWEEECYEGYGEFGGKDYYELVAEMNGKTTRDEGIELSYQADQEGILYPNLTQTKRWKWRNAKAETCEFQGFFYH